MIKTDIIFSLEKEAQLTRKQAESVVNICFGLMIKALYEDERVEIRGFGSFVNRNYKSYEGRNPKTGNIVKVAPKKVPFFKVGKALKKAVEASRNQHNIQDV